MDMGPLMLIQVVGLEQWNAGIKLPIRVAMRIARAQRIGQRGKKRAYLAQPKADWGQTWPSLALSWAEQELICAQLGPNLRRTRASWLQLVPNRSPTWRNLGTFGRKLGLAATWSRAGASGAEVRPKTSPMWAAWPYTNAHQSNKNVGNSTVALSPQNWLGLGPRLGPGLPPSWAQVALSWTQPSWRQ